MCQCTKVSSEYAAHYTVWINIVLCFKGKIHTKHLHTQNTKNRAYFNNTTITAFVEQSESEQRKIAINFSYSVTSTTTIAFHYICIHRSQFVFSVFPGMTWLCGDVAQSQHASALLFVSASSPAGQHQIIHAVRKIQFWFSCTTWTPLEIPLGDADESNGTGKLQAGRLNLHSTGRFKYNHIQ